MKRPIIFILFTLFTFHFSFAQGTIRGTVFDDGDGESVPFANVMLYEHYAQGAEKMTKFGCATDLNGFFMINRVPAGTYTLRVRFVGYEEYSETITVANGKTPSLKAPSALYQAGIKGIVAA